MATFSYKSCPIQARLSPHLAHDRHASQESALGMLEGGEVDMTLILAILILLTQTSIAIALIVRQSRKREL